MSTHPEDQATMQPVRTRTTLCGDGSASIVRTVYCESRGRTVAIDECVRCGHGDVTALAARGASSIRCRAPRIDSVVASRPTSATSATEARVASIMTRDVICLRAEVAADTTLRLLVEREIGGAPVVSADGSPYGVISKSDFLRLSADGLGSTELPAEPQEPGRRTFTPVVVGDLMTPIVFTIPEDAKVAAAAAVMAVEGVHRLPVVDEANQVVGVVSSLDLARWIAEQAAILPPRA